MSAQQRRVLRKALKTRDPDEFRFEFYNVPIYDIYHKRGATVLAEPIRLAYEALSSPALKQAVHTVTGADVRFCDAQLTRFDHRSSLTAHDDDVLGKNRRLAYTLGLARRWRPSWGGALEFLSDEERVIERLYPQWNTLTLFAVPSRHRVGKVTLDAREPRLSIAGWYRHGEPEPFVTLPGA